MSDEMGAVAEDLGDVGGVDLKVLPLGWRATAEASAVEQQESVALGQGSLFSPVLCAPAEAAVHHHDRFAGAPGDRVEVAHRTVASRAARLVARSRPIGGAISGSRLGRARQWT